MSEKDIFIEGCVMGIDIGTTSIKVSVVSMETRSVICAVTRNTEAIAQLGDVEETRLHSEQDVVKIIEVLDKCLSEINIPQINQVKGIGITGQMHGVMFWSVKTYLPVVGGGVSDETTLQCVVSNTIHSASNLITWEDKRCSQDFVKSLPKPDSHLRLAPGFGCLSTLWLAKNRSNYFQENGYTCAGTVMDYVACLFCGLDRPVMSVQNAASWGYFNTESKTWNTQILSDAGFPVRLLPKVVDPGTVIGYVTSAIIPHPGSISVYVALGDLQCAFRSGIRDNNVAVINLSTSAQVGFPLPQDYHIPPIDINSPVEYFPYFHNTHIAVAASLNGGNALMTFMNMVRRWLADLEVSVPSESDMWKRLITTGSQVSRDPDIRFNPTFNGERHLPSETASISGLTASNTSLGNVFMSLCIGLVRNLHSMMSTEYLTDHKIDKIMATGSVIAKNTLIRRALQDIYKIPVQFGQTLDSANGVAFVVIDSITENIHIIDAV